MLTSSTDLSKPLPAKTSPGTPRCRNEGPQSAQKPPLRKLCTTRRRHCKSLNLTPAMAFRIDSDNCWNHEPRPLLGQIEIFATHPVTIARTLVAQNPSEVKLDPASVTQGRVPVRSRRRISPTSEASRVLAPATALTARSPSPPPAPYSIAPGVR